MELIAALKDAGALHFKSHDFEVSFAVGAAPLVQPSPPPSVPVDYPPVNQEATARAQDVIDKLKMNDEELLDKLFPAGAGG